MKDKSYEESEVVCVNKTQSLDAVKTFSQHEATVEDIEENIVDNLFESDDPDKR